MNYKTLKKRVNIISVKIKFWLLEEIKSLSLSREKTKTTFRILFVFKKVWKFVYKQLGWPPLYAMFVFVIRSLDIVE